MLHFVTSAIKKIKSHGGTGHELCNVKKIAFRTIQKGVIMSKIKAYFDGLCEPNPSGVATWGIVVFENDNIIYKDCGIACEPYTQQSTNNFAEYTGLINVIRYCLDNGLLDIEVIGDSQLAIRQMTGVYSVNSPNIIPLYNEAIKLSQNFNNITFTWVRRELNTVADSMSKEAYFKYISKNDIVMQFGKYKGKSISYIAQKNPNYIQWLLNESNIRPDFKDAIKVVLQKT